MTVHLPARHAPSWRRRTFTLSALSLAAALGAGCSAGPAEAAGGPSAGRLVEIEIVDRDSGEVLTVYASRGRRYVAGRPGARYAIRLTNRSGQRLLTVVSVDGVNVLDGRTAAWDQGGYVLAPWQRYDLTGWRKSDAQVAAFEFTALPDSYAARTGRPLDVGVIGVAVFRERPPAPFVLREPASIAPPPPLASLPAPAPARESAATQARAADAQEKAAADTAGAAAQSAPLARKRLGTGHGEREESWVSTTTFERAAATPDETVAIQYDRLDNLVAAGIVATPIVTTVPRAFPGSPGFIGYVPDPPRR